jgi:hypothetical protein
MEIEIEKTLAGLHSRHLNGFFAENIEEAQPKILSLIPEHATVGIGDSATLRQMGILKLLRDRGSKVLDGFKIEGPKIDPKEAPAYHREIVKQASLTDVFLTGTNALTQDGRLVNVDAVGNRVSGMVWGHPISVIVVGKNKIVKDLDEAFHRIRSVIAPNHVRIRAVELGGRKRNTPCVNTGECSDCRSTEKICNIFTIIEGKPFHTDLNVIIVNEDLGLAWDSVWPKDRIKRIRENYKRFAWIAERIYR